MIKAVNKNDFPECIDVITRSFMTVADEYGITRENAPAFVAFATDEAKLTHWMDNQHRPMYGYYDGDKLVGYYNLMISGKECEIGSLSVLPEYRHGGIGSVLVEDALNKAREFGCNLMKLSIVEENQVLRKWYEAQGFVHTGTIKYDFFPFTCGYLEKQI